MHLDNIPPVLHGVLALHGITGRSSTKQLHCALAAIQASEAMHQSQMMRELLEAVRELRRVAERG